MSDSDDEANFLEEVGPSFKNDIFHHFTQLFNKGSVVGYIGLAGCHYKGISTKVDKPQAVSLYLEAALRGDSHAQVKLALCFLKGSGTALNISKAFDWFKRASLSNSPYALYALSTFHFYGHIVKVNLQVSRTNLLQAVKLGSSHAHTEYATQLLFLDDDMDEALIHLKKATVHGNLWAKYFLGTLYLYGEHKDLRQEGLSLLISAARRGKPSAQLAFAYFTRDQIVTSAFVNGCLTQAALSNHPEAVYERGVRLLSGIGFQQNLLEAKIHFHRAHLLGFPVAFYMITLVNMLLEGRVTLETLDADLWRSSSHSATYPTPLSGEIVRSPYASNLPGIPIFRPTKHVNPPSTLTSTDDILNESEAIETTTSTPSAKPIQPQLVLDTPTTLSLIQSNLSKIIPLPRSFSNLGQQHTAIQLPSEPPVSVLKPLTPFPDPRLEKCFCCSSTQRQILSSCGHWLFCNTCFQLFPSCPICGTLHTKSLITQVKPTLCYFSS